MNMQNGMAPLQVPDVVSSSSSNHANKSLQHIIGATQNDPNKLHFIKLSLKKKKKPVYKIKEHKLYFVQQQNNDLKRSMNDEG